MKVDIVEDFGDKRKQNILLSMARISSYWGIAYHSQPSSDPV